MIQRRCTIRAVTIDNPSHLFILASALMLGVGPLSSCSDTEASAPGKGTGGKTAAAPGGRSGLPQMAAGAPAGGISAGNGGTSAAGSAGTDGYAGTDASVPSVAGSG